MNFRLKSIAKRLLAFGLPDVAPIRFVYRQLYRLTILSFEGFQWLKKVFWGEPMFRAVCARVGKRLRIERMPYITGRGRIEIGDDCYISGKIGIGFGDKLGLDPVLRIGSHCFIGHDCAFSLAQEISIGDHCLIAGGVRFCDNDGHPKDAGSRRRNEPVRPEDVRPIKIGDDVWIGTGAIVLKGVSIGDRAIVGAGAVVVRDVQPDTVVAGNPARLIRTLTEQLPDRAR